MSRATLDRDWLRQRTGDLSQIASAREIRLVDGNEDGVRAVDVRSLNGIHALVLVDRGMDIGPAWLSGVPLSWQSPTGIVHPAYFRDDVWLRSFHGGLLTTCGLQNVGEPNADGGVRHGLHGRISNIPARNVTSRIVADPKGLVVEVEGDVRESEVYGASLLLHRRFRFPVGVGRVDISDSIENTGAQQAALMLLYHFNVGYPLIDDESRLVAPDATVIAMDEGSQLHVAEHALCTPPRDDAPVLVFEHRLVHRRARSATIGIFNPSAPGVGSVALAVSYSPLELPKLWQWKALSSGMYVIGLEPANCGVLGRAREREDGTLEYLQPGERRDFHLSVAAAIGVDARRLLRGRGPGEVARSRAPRLGLKGGASAAANAVGGKR